MEEEKVISQEVLPLLVAWWEKTRPRGLDASHLTHFARPHATALYWSRVLVQNEISDPHRAIIRRALVREGVPEPLPEEVERWAKELPAELRVVLANLGLEDVSAQDLYEPKSVEGLFFLDARAALAFEKRGALSFANVIRTEGAKHWESYQEGLTIASPLSRALCTPALWWLFANEKLRQDGLTPFGLALFVARAMLQERREKAPTTEPTKDTKKEETPTATAKEPHTKETVSTVHIEIARLYSATYKPEKVELSEDSSQVLRNGEVLASVPSLPKKDLALLQRGLHQVGSLTFRRAVNYLVRACWERHQQGEARPEIITFQGIEQFAQLIGQPDNAHSKAIQQALLQGQCFWLSWPGGIIGGLWMYYYQRAWPGRKAFLEVELSRVLRPHYGMAELESPWRVPVVQLAPMVGRHNEHAAQASLQERLILELVERRVELIKYGGARILNPEWRRLADEVGLPHKMLPALLERWQHTAEDGEAFLEKNGEHYLLATTKPYRAARSFLLEAGRRTLAAKEAGKKGVLIHLSHLQGHPKRKNKLPKK